jgi:aspartate 1-decarboxylase
VIIVTYVDVEETEVPSHRPTVVVVDEDNRVVDAV